MEIKFWRRIITPVALIIAYFFFIHNKTGNRLNLGIALFAGLILILYEEFLIKSNKNWIKIKLQEVSKMNQRQRDGLTHLGIALAVGSMVLAGFLEGWEFYFMGFGAAFFAIFALIELFTSIFKDK